ncbi:MAG TPA: FHA domain-containing protein [Kofleriaceae bacterium]|nr:FHA domain-containing protein [Kofleriaceae bacterium]
MLRFEVSEHDREALPPIDITDDVVVIGSAPSARIRLPAEIARPAHIRIEGQTWTLLAESIVGGMVRAAGDSGSVGHGIVIELGKVRVRISASPAGAAATPPARTESLARELVRSLLGDGAAPSLEIERGAGAGARRTLPPPEARLVIGRGDEATWVILDEDLSRAHAEIRRGWDGVTVVDMTSKNGTRVNGAPVRHHPVELHDGATLTLGNLVLRFRDPAERHLRGEPAIPPGSSPGAPDAPGALGASTAPVAPRPARPWPFIAFVVIAALAVAALVWVLAT